MLQSVFKYYLFLAVISLSNVCFLVAQDAGNEHTNAENIFRSVYDFRFREADSMIAATNVSDPVKQLLQADLLWWKTISSNNREKFTAFIKQFVAQTETSDFWLTFEGQVAQQSYYIRYNLVERNYLKAFKEYMTLKRLLKEGKGISNPELDEFAGLFQVYLDYLEILENYYYRSLYSKKATFTAALKIAEIETQVDSGNIIYRTLGHYFLYKFYSEVDSDKDKSLRHADFLAGEYPNNTVFQGYINDQEAAFEE
ncbi:MAG: hypothetical protein KDC05_00285 [Bacteroidales bacterium]|nr:hypothetical protein [Bacteroidales bacterium]